MTAAQKRLKESREHQGRVKDAYLFILAGEHNAASLAAKLGVSVPTCSRLVEALKRDLVKQGKRLVSVRSDEGFHYEIRDDERSRRITRDPLVALLIPARGGGRKGLKDEDRDIYDRD